MLQANIQLQTRDLLNSNTCVAISPTSTPSASTAFSSGSSSAASGSASKGGKYRTDIENLSKGRLGLEDLLHLRLLIKYVYDEVFLFNTALALQHSHALASSNCLWIVWGEAVLLGTCGGLDEQTGDWCSFAPLLKWCSSTHTYTHPNHKKLLRIIINLP